MPIAISDHQVRPSTPNLCAGPSGKIHQWKTLLCPLCIPFPVSQLCLHPWKSDAAQDRGRSTTIRVHQLYLHPWRPETTQGNQPGEAIGDYQLCLYTWKPDATRDNQLYLQLQSTAAISDDQFYLQPQRPASIRNFQVF